MLLKAFGNREALAKSLVVMLLAVLHTVLAQFSPDRYDAPVPIEILNSPFDEFAPEWYGKEHRLYFSSNRTGRTLFYSAPYQNKQFGKPEVAKNLQFFDHQSYCRFVDSLEMYFSSFRYTAKQPYLNLYRVEKGEWRWENPKLLERFAVDAFVSHPTLCDNGNVLVFASDRAGGKGGIDLWIVRKAENGVWEEPRPLMELNSSGNEITPYFLSCDTLIFASDGFGGKGGYDLYYTTFQNGYWQPPIPLHFLNSEFDESDCIVLPDRSILFASNRPGSKGKLDLYLSVFKPKKALPPLPKCEIAVHPSAITIEEIQWVEAFPLLPFLFFPKDQATLPQWYIMLESSEQFDTTQVAPVLEKIYAHILNIIGARLHRYPQATLTIRGSASRDEQNRLELGKARAEAVAHYLERIWQIPPERLIVEAVEKPHIPSNPVFPEGREENRRVELRSNQSAILAPLVLAAKQYTIQPEVIAVSATVQPRAIVAQWELSVHNGADTELFHAGGSKLPQEDIEIPLQQWIHSLRAQQNCMVSFRVRDQFDRSVLCEHLIPVTQLSIVEKKQQQLNDRTIERYSLILFGYNEAQLRREHQEQLRRIAQEIPPNAKIIVRGYTDVIGDEQYNLELSKRRALAVAQFLRVLLPTVQIEVEPIGEYALFDNTTPFGRFYSRTVQIIVEKPVISQ